VHDLQHFAGMRSRLRASILLALILLTFSLILPLARRTHIFTRRPKIRIYLETDLAEFQKQFDEEHESLGQYVACPSHRESPLVADVT
jgi:hypothetical protein